MYNPFKYVARVDSTLDVVLLVCAVVMAFLAGAALSGVLRAVEERVRGRDYLPIRPAVAGVLGLLCAVPAGVGAREYHRWNALQEIDAREYEIVEYEAARLPGFRSDVDGVLRPDGRITRADVAVLHRAWEVRKRADDARRVAEAKQRLGADVAVLR